LKIGLLSPKSSFLSNNSDFNEFWKKSKFIDSYRKNWSGLSSALLIIAALTPSKHEIEIIDENIEPIDFSRSYDLIAITSMTQQANRAYSIADTFRKKGITVIIGGIHPTILPNEAIEHADCIGIGEAENIWPTILDDFIKGKLKRFYYADPINLNNSPIPRFELIKQKCYKIIWLQTSRGCPHNCEFCAASKVFGHKYRYKSNDQVLNEIFEVKNILPQIIIGFGDDNFLANKNRAKKLLKELIPLNIRYYLQTDISIANDNELLKLLNDSGCINVFIGFESVSKEGLKNIDDKNWKYKQVDNYPNYIKKIQSHGIGIMGAFILGLDKDDEFTFNKTCDFIIKNNLYDAQISILTPLPGTRLRDRLFKENRLLNTTWDNYTVWNVNFIHPKLSKTQLEAGLLQIYQNINTEKRYNQKLEYFKNIQKKLIKGKNKQ